MEYPKGETQCNQLPINMVLRNLVNENGVEMLRDANRVNSFLMDLAPRSHRERKLIVMVIREGVVCQLNRVIDDSEENQRMKINMCVRQLVNDVLITEAAAQYAVLTIASAIGMNIGSNEGLMFLQLPGNENKNAAIMKTLTKAMELKSMDAISYALQDCNAIGYKALASNTGIEEVDLPASITAIYPKAFLNCINLRRITIPKEVKSIGTCVFEGCCSLEDITIHDGSMFRVTEGLLIDRVNRRVIRALNSSECNMVNIADGLTTICKKAFERSGVRSINLSSTVGNIEKNAFYLTMNLEGFSVDPKNRTFRAIDGVLHNRRGNVLIRYPQAKAGISYYIEDSVDEIGCQAFSCAKNLETVTFTGRVTKISNNAFEYCSRINNMMLPGSMISVGDRAFQYCISMKSIMLPMNITAIGDCAFFNCTSLELINIPHKVQTIGNYAFANCVNLKSIIIQDCVTHIGDGAFSGCGAVISIRNNSYVEMYCRSRGIEVNILQ